MSIERELIERLGEITDLISRDYWTPSEDEDASYDSFVRELAVLRLRDGEAFHSAFAAVNVVMECFFEADARTVGELR